MDTLVDSKATLKTPAYAAKKAKAEFNALVDRTARARPA